MGGGQSLGAHTPLQMDGPHRDKVQDVGWVRWQQQHGSPLALDTGRKEFGGPGSLTSLAFHQSIQPA
jgi:hypothetical protein